MLCYINAGTAAHKHYLLIGKAFAQLLGTIQPYDKITDGIHLYNQSFTRIVAASFIIKSGRLKLNAPDIHPSEHLCKLTF
jgi:hypothetical protein